MTALMTELMDAGAYAAARQLEHAHDCAERAALLPCDRYGRNPQYDRACEYLKTVRRQSYRLLMSASTAQEA